MSNEESSESRFIKKETVPAPEGKFVVISTVDLSGPYENGRRLSTSFLGGHIETMVFRADESGRITDWSDIDSARTHFRDAALEQHAAMVAKWRVSQ